MKTENMNFGRFIKAKRLADDRELTLKDVAAALDMSISMVSDIEQGRRKPFDAEKIEAFCDFLLLSAEDKARMYDLAAREKSEVPYDIEDTMMYTQVGEYARLALRMTNAGVADVEDWKSFIRKLESKKEDSNNGAVSVQPSGGRRNSDNY